MQEEQFEDINIVTSDHVNLQGYLYKEKKEKTPLAIYFGGRGEEATNIAEYASKIRNGWALAFINYRGCGSSTGTQNNEQLFSDAAIIYDYFSNRDDIDKKNIVVISHSLGTGIAIHLALQRDIKGIILSCPYDKYVTGVIQDKLPLVPLKLLIKEEYNSISIAPKLSKPVLFLLAEDDKTVVRGRSMKLYNHWGSNNRKVSIINDTNHENITFHDLTWSKMNTFLDIIQ
jgi:pimeloyl-ACP methyl ester carboxylesterase